VRGNDLARWRMAGAGASIEQAGARMPYGIADPAKVCAAWLIFPAVRAIDQAECVRHEFSLIRDRAVCSHHDARADFVRIRALWLIPLDLKVRVTARRLIAEPLDGA
jgi:hypothetical protein